MSTNYNTLGSLTETEQINKPSKQRNQGESLQTRIKIQDSRSQE